MIDMWWFCGEYGNDKNVVDPAINLAGSRHLQRSKERDHFGTGEKLLLKFFGVVVGAQ